MIYDFIKMMFGGLNMDWLQFLQIVCIPAFIWLVYDMSSVKRDLSDFKLKVADDAKDYATNDAILRMESKIDGLRDLIIEELRPKRVKK